MKLEEKIAEIVECILDDTAIADQSEWLAKRIAQSLSSLCVGVNWDDIESECLDEARSCAEGFAFDFDNIKSAISSCLNIRTEEEVAAEAREKLLHEMSSEASDAGWWIGSRGDSGGEAGMIYEWVDGYRSLQQEGK